MENNERKFPEVTLGQYKGLPITRHVRPVTEKTLDIEMVHQTRMHARYLPVTTPAQRGQRVILDFAGYLDGEEIPLTFWLALLVVSGGLTLGLLYGKRRKQREE